VLPVLVIVDPARTAKQAADPRFTAVIPGAGVGVAVGTAVGIAVGTDVGTEVGTAVGIAVGTNVGTEVGIAVGVPVGAAVGEAIGTSVGVVHEVIIVFVSKVTAAVCVSAFPSIFTPVVIVIEACARMVPLKVE
jgi:hypothetical protein